MVLRPLWRQQNRSNKSFIQTTRCVPRDCIKNKIMHNFHKMQVIIASSCSQEFYNFDHPFHKNAICILKWDKFALKFLSFVKLKYHVLSALLKLRDTHSFFFFGSDRIVPVEYTPLPFVYLCDTMSSTMALRGLLIILDFI